MSKTKSIIVAGGGLAGLTSALHLRKLGWPVTIIDKASFPRHKVCGEYVSNEVTPYLKWLGADPEELQPAHISKIAFSTASGETIHEKLPLGGFGISRYALDHHLYQKAVQMGCKTLQASIKNIDFSNDRFDVSLDDDTTISADVVLGAFGKRSNIDQKMRRHFIFKKTPWLAVKAHYQIDLPDDVVGLHNFDGGYCGVSHIENGLVNVCYLAHTKTFKKYKDLDGYQRQVLSKNPILKKIFAQATPVFDKPLTISQINFDPKRCVEGHILMIGDTAGLIHPFCGNGMAIAIHSAKIASELVHNYLSGTIASRKKLEESYRHQWNRTFRFRLGAGRLLGKLLQHQGLSEWCLRALTFFPSLFPMLIRQTHGKPIPVGS